MQGQRIGESQEETEAEIGVMHSQASDAKDFWHPLEAMKRRGRILPSSL